MKHLGGGVSPQGAVPTPRCKLADAGWVRGEPRWSKPTLVMLQEYMEAYLIALVEDTNLCCQAERPA